MNIEEQLLQFFGAYTDAEVALNTHLVEESVIDSMGVMELIAFIEATYYLQLDMDDLTIENFATINNIKNFIRQARAKS